MQGFQPIIQRVRCESLSVTEEDLIIDEPVIVGKNLNGIFNQQSLGYPARENGNINHIKMPGYPGLVPHEPFISEDPHDFSTPKKVDSPKDPILVNSDEILVNHH